MMHVVVCKMPASHAKVICGILREQGFEARRRSLGDGALAVVEVPCEWPEDIERTRRRVMQALAEECWSGIMGQH